jgi:hypothetical protein
MRPDSRTLGMEEMNKYVAKISVSVIIAIAGCMGREAGSLHSVLVSESGACSVRDSEVDCARVADQLIQTGASSTSVVTVVTDRRAPFESVKAALDSLKSAGMRHNLRTSS